MSCGGNRVGSIGEPGAGTGLSSEFKLSSNQTPRCTPSSIFYVMMKLGPGKGKVFMSLALCSQTPAMKTDQRFALSSAAAVPSDPLLFFLKKKRQT